MFKIRPELAALIFAVLITIGASSRAYALAATAAACAESCEETRARMEQDADTWYNQQLADCRNLYFGDAVALRCCQAAAYAEQAAAYAAAEALYAACVAAREAGEAAEWCRDHTLEIVAAGGTGYLCYRVGRQLLSCLGGPPLFCASAIAP